LNIVTGDTKNFHAWKYRSWLVERAGKSPHSEEDFTRRLLEVEPNNFSALHHRIVALTAAHTSATTAGEHAATQHSMERGETDRGQPEFAATSISVEDKHSHGTEVPTSVDAQRPSAEGSHSIESTSSPDMNTIQAARMHYTGARVVPLSLGVIERELQALFEVRGCHPILSEKAYECVEQLVSKLLRKVLADVPTLC
jgi:hypothetical protein